MWIGLRVHLEALHRSISNNSDNNAKAGGSQHGESALLRCMGSFEDFVFALQKATKKPRQLKLKRGRLLRWRTGLTHTTATARNNTRMSQSD